MKPTDLLRAALQKTAANLLHEFKMPAAVAAGTTAGSAALSDGQNFRGDLATGLLAGAGAAGIRGGFRQAKHLKDIRGTDAEFGAALDRATGHSIDVRRHDAEARGHADSLRSTQDELKRLTQPQTPLTPWDIPGELAARAPYRRVLENGVTTTRNKLKASEWEATKSRIGSLFERHNANKVHDVGTAQRGARNRDAVRTGAVGSTLAGTGLLTGAQDTEQGAATPDAIAANTTEGRKGFVERTSDAVAGDLKPVEQGAAAVKELDLPGRASEVAAGAKDLAEIGGATTKGFAEAGSEALKAGGQSATPALQAGEGILDSASNAVRHAADLRRPAITAATVGAITAAAGTIGAVGLLAYLLTRPRKNAKTAANLRANVAPVKATSSYAPSPAIAPRGPGMAARMKAFDAPMKPAAPPAVPAAPKPTMPAAVTPRPLGQPVVPAAPPPALAHPFRPGAPPSIDAMLTRLGVGSQPAPSLSQRINAALPRFGLGTTASTAASGALAGVSGVAAKNLADQQAQAPQQPPQGPVAAPEAEPELKPDVPMGPRFDPLQGMPA